MAEKVIPVRTVLMPAYYRDFHCIMGACQDNCCDDGWKIEFNKKDYLTIKRAVQSGEMKELMSQSLRRLREKEHDGMYAEFQMTGENRCSFHTPEGLCRLQMECGEKALPTVCRIFPRREKYTLSALEKSLSPGCEGVLALLWKLPQGIDFLEEALPKKEWKDLEPISPVSSQFARIRSLWIDTLQDRALRLPRRMLLLGILTQQLQELDWNNSAAIENWLVQWEQARASLSITQQLNQLHGNQKMFISNGLRLIASLHYDQKHELAQELTDAVVNDVKEGKKQKVFLNHIRYAELAAQLDELLDHSDYFFENLMVTVVFHASFPDLGSPKALWNCYITLCNLYSYYRFAAVCAMDKEVSKERLCHVLVHVSRMLIHSNKRLTNIRDELFQNDSATLAHMAILLDG